MRTSWHEKSLRMIVLFTLRRPRQNCYHIADDIFKCNFLKENLWLFIAISLEIVPRGTVDNIPVLVQIMAWRRPGDKPLSKAMMVRLLTHICVTRPQWVTWRESICPSQRVSILQLWCVCLVIMKQLLNKELNGRWSETPWHSYDVIGVIWSWSLSNSIPLNLTPLDKLFKLLTLSGPNSKICDEIFIKVHIFLNIFTKCSTLWSMLKSYIKICMPVKFQTIWMENNVIMGTFVEKYHHSSVSR